MSSVSPDFPSIGSPESPAVPEAKSSSSAGSSDDDRKPRTLILCFDGTASQYDGNNTNVVKLYSLLKKDDDNAQQLCYYQPGIGTYFNPGAVSPLFQWGAKILDEAFAWYLDAHVRGGYQFLMQNYNAGDRICLFGFSRGAYTARALAGMLHKIGLLPRDNPEQVPFAYKLYKKTDKDSIALAAGFKQTFCRSVQIEFVGVWETVASVGVLMSHSLPFTTANTTIKTFRHALALDEHRVKFLPNFYHRDPPKQKGLASTTPPSASDSERSQERSPEGTSSVSSVIPKKTKKSGWLGRSTRSAAKVEEAKLQQNHAKAQVEEGVSPTASDTSHLISNALGDRIAGGTDVLEVWFAGCHGDVGGGAVDDDVTVSLSDITLRWMVREVVLAQCGIAFDQAALARANIPESIFRGTGFALPAKTTTRKPPRHGGFTPQGDAVLGTSSIAAAPRENGNEPQAGDPHPKGRPASDGSGGDPLETSADALSPIHDTLKLTPMWWLLEIVPTWYPWQDAEGNWKSRLWFHLGRGRQVPIGEPPKFHVTVRERMQDPTLKYTPRAKWVPGTEVYVD